ncbi:G-type lectin S-receptor-like serine/threonine-protein kinase, partial [Mucuna pruriens]
TRVPTTLRAIQTLFNVTRVTDILAANGLPEWTLPNNFTVDESRVVRIPFECDCNGPGLYGEPTNPPVYTVQRGDNISYIVTSVFSGLVDSKDIQKGNNMESLLVGEEVRVLLPCSCGQVNGVDVVHFGLTRENGLTLEQIADEYHVPLQTIRISNQATNPRLMAGHPLDIPLPVCSSVVRKDSLDYPLHVPHGSYVYTANGCVRCNCDAAKNWKLSCEPSKLKPTNWSTCPSMQCDNSSNMYIGDTTYSSSHNHAICAYAGYGTQTIFTTLAAESNPSGLVHEHDTKSRWWIWFTMIGGVIVVLIFCYFCCIIWRKCKLEAGRKKKQKELLQEIGVSTVASTVYHKTKRHSKGGKANYEMQIFNFPIIVAATDNFSVANKLGQGGFGPVYKGELPDGQEIAIKRLSSRSGQGLVEFKNEAELVAKLQHTNLVRLLGLCIQNEENILIYEYMPNKSLDFHLFDSNRREAIVWEKRSKIIEGIAHGLIYLHHFSRLKVIHRDLKASNILLDYEMNPKISDFGMAVILDMQAVEVKAKRIVGTYGYMSPEYVIKGIISTKTDVFSYGVLVLEIISGKKNNCRYQSDYPLNLIGSAWQLWNEGKGVELIDSSMLESCRTAEVLRCIQVGLLCVQANAADRPSMLEVYSMLAHETLFLPIPKQPAYFTDACAYETNALVGKQKSYSTNEVTISVGIGLIYKMKRSQKMSTRVMLFLILQLLELSEAEQIGIYWGQNSDEGNLTEACATGK